MTKIGDDFLLMPLEVIELAESITPEQEEFLRRTVRDILRQPTLKSGIDYLLDFGINIRALSDPLFDELNIEGSIAIEELRTLFGTPVLAQYALYKGLLNETIVLRVGKLTDGSRQPVYSNPV